LALLDFKSALCTNEVICWKQAKRAAEEHAEVEWKACEELTDCLKTKEGKEELFTQLSIELQKPQASPTAQLNESVSPCFISNICT
jgi:hypothetical protein